MRKLFASIFFLMFITTLFSSCQLLPRNDIDEPISSEYEESETPTIKAISGFNYQTVQNFNIAASGYLSKNDGFTYFMNPNDEWKLYKSQNADLSDAVKLNDCSSDTRLGRMQVCNGKLYYCIAERLDEIIETDSANIAFLKRILCYNIATGVTEALTDFIPIESFAVYNDELFYTAYIEQENTFALCNASCEMVLELAYPMSVQQENGKLFLGFNESLMIYDIEKKTVQTEMLIHSSFAVSNGTIWYINLNDSCLYKTSFESENGILGESVKISDKAISSFNVYGDKVLLSAFEEFAIYEIDTATDSSQILCKGSNPVIISSGVYYISEDGSINLIPFV